MPGARWYNGYMESPVLLRGDLVRCPKCGRIAPRTAYKNLDIVADMRAWLVPIRKCPQCSHLFAARVHAAAPESNM